MSDQPDDTLIALIDRIAQRDEAALKGLYDLVSSKLYGLSLRVVGGCPAFPRRPGTLG